MRSCSQVAALLLGLGIAVSKGDGQPEAETSSLVSVNSATVCKSRPVRGTLTGKAK